MKILLGVCGLGNGHSTRQHAIVAEFLRRGHDVALFTHQQSSTYFRRYAPRIPAWPIWIPVIAPADWNGLCFDQIATQIGNRRADGIETNFRAMHECRTYFNGAPDVVISDYEPTSAQFAYALGTRFVTIDNQSICLGYKAPTIGGFGPEEESSRLRLFFPRADARIVLSWAEPNWEVDSQYPVTLHAPCVRQEFSLGPSGIAKSHAVVYFSPYEPVRQHLDDVLATLSEIDRWKFTIFAPGNAMKKGSKNVSFSDCDSETFTRALLQADAVIATAGFSLLTECLSLQLPVYLMPLRTYEQNLNARLVADAQLGVTYDIISTAALKEFLADLQHFRSALTKYKNVSHLMPRADGASLIVDTILQRFQ